MQKDNIEIKLNGGGTTPVHCSCDKLVSLEKICPNPQNPNKHSEQQIELLAKIIKEQGWRQPVKVSNRSGYIVSGHGRYLAAELMGAERVPVDYQDYESEEQEYADLLADNRIAELAEMDNAMLAELFEKIDLSGFDRELTGYTEDDWSDILDSFDEEAVDIEAADDVLPELPDEPFTKPGDIYLIGRHRLICGDSTEPETYKKLMEEDRAQLIITDPPYNADYEGKAGKIENDNLASDEFRQFLGKAFQCFSEYSQPGAAAYIFHADKESVAFKTEFEEAGFLAKQCLIWAKNHFVLGRQDYQWQHEPCLYGWKDGAGHYFADERTNSTMLNQASRPDFFAMNREELIEFLECVYDEFEQIPGTIIYCDKPQRSDLHPTTKPVKLLDKLIKNSSRQGWIVLDAFCGSGSTLIACEASGRCCRAIELDPQFCDVIVKRYIEVTGKKDIYLLRNGKKIAYEDIENRS